MSERWRHLEEDWWELHMILPSPDDNCGWPNSCTEEEYNNLSNLLEDLRIALAKYRQAANALVNRPKE